MKIVEKNIKEKRYIFILALCYLVALLIFSCYTSPLYPNYYGYDSAIFSLIGKGLVEGKQLYKDLFDHKGPVIFLITAFAHSLGGHYCIILLQGVFGIISLVFCFLTGRLLRPGRKFASFWECFAIFFSVYAVFVFTFQRGNLTEEYSLPFISCSLYLFVRYAVCADESPEHSPFYALLHGINLACLFFLRLNNAATIGMGVLALTIYLLYRRRYLNLVWNLFSGFLGVAIISVPMIYWFFSKGLLHDLLYATFLHNLIIAGNTGHISFFQDPVKLFALYLPIGICCCFAFSVFLHRKTVKFVDVLLLSILGMNIVSLGVANRFPHYFTVFSPVYAAFLCRYFVFDGKSLKTKAVVFCTVLNLAFACYFSYASLCDVYISKTAMHRNETIHAYAENIPENERDSVIGYKIDARDYLAADIIPCHKYFTLQDTWSITNPEILTEFLLWIETEKPVWVLIRAEENDTSILGVLDEFYEFKFGNEYISFFRIKKSE